MSDDEFFSEKDRKISKLGARARHQHLNALSKIEKLTGEQCLEWIMIVARKSARDAAKELVGALASGELPFERISAGNDLVH